MLHMNSPAENLLKEKRLRVTPARLATLDVLLTADHALTHLEIDQSLADAGARLDRVTLYRTLDFLVAENLAHRLANDDRVWRFSAQPRTGGHTHPHFHCDGCGTTMCLGDLNPAMVVSLPDGYVFRQAELTLHGLCPACNSSR